MMKKKIWSTALRVTRWLLPLAILLVIFRSIDWEQFIAVLYDVDYRLVLAGFLYYPLVIALGALRWHTMLRAYHAGRVRYTSSLRDYWSGLALGLFAPASVGWDVYRVTAATKRYGNVIANSATIIVEKIMALLTCASLVTLLVPFMDIAADNEELQQIIRITHFVLVGTLGSLAIAVSVARHEASIRFFRDISNKLKQWLDQLSQRNDLSATSQTIPLELTFAPLRSTGILFSVTMYSFLIQLTSAVGNQIYFIAVDYDLPLLVNLFVVPVLYFVFLLPISFGSLGIREGAYILIYGAFGVPMETALLVSFFNLFGLLLNNLIGGILLALGVNRPA